MAKLTHDAKWTGSNDQTVKQKTYTFSTNEKYVDKDIALTVNVPSMTLFAGEDFVLTDTINSWHWEIDANGNVLIY